MSATADRNLLFGILAVQLDFVTKDALVAAMSAWLLDKTRALGEVLRDQGQLSIERLQLLSALVAEHLRQHEDNAVQSLATLMPVDARLQQRLAALQDDDVQATMKHIGAAGAETPSAEAIVTIAQPPSVVQTAGRYRILKLHAKGGLGEVFVAEDTELGRHVALKEIQARHAVDPISRNRFLLEAEVTGSLEHPGIVPVYGLGTYEDGRPFYAMRLVKGDNLRSAITRFHSLKVDFDSLEFRELLSRFVDVCQAIAYAHSRGVLHRDLKPGNIMLGKYGETLVVDWGLAKLQGSSRPQFQDAQGDADSTLRPRMSGDSSATVFGEAMGTPAYMPPEQAAGDWQKLGPASDVYSLGAMLYELLTSQPPAKGIADEVLDRVKRGDIRRPCRVNAGVPPALEAVCLKAMALKPEDRYASALDVGKEIERWLADEPVTAWQEPIGVRGRRWLRKHSRLVIASAATLVVGVISLGFVALERERARQAVDKERAETARQRDEKVAALETAEQRSAQNERGMEILSSVFRNLDPRAVKSEETPVRTLLGEQLDQAAALLQRDAIADPLSVAGLQMTLGESLLHLSFPDKAIMLFKAAHATLVVQLGPDHPDTLRSLMRIAECNHDSGKLDLAIPLLSEVLELRQTKLGRDHADTLTSVNSLAVAYLSAGRVEIAIPLFEETVKLRKAKLGPDHPDTLVSLNNLAMSYQTAGKLDLAIALLQETLTLTRARLGLDHPATLASTNNLAVSYDAAGKPNLAIPLFEESLRLQRATVGSDHADTLTAMNNLASGYQAVGKLELALPLFEESLKLRRAKLGLDHSKTLISLNNLASCYQDAGKLDLAAPLYEEAVRLKRMKLGVDHPSTLGSMHNLAHAFLATKEYVKAESMLREILVVRERKDSDDWMIFNTKSTLGRLMLDQKRYVEAELLLIAGYDGMKQRQARIPPKGKVALAAAVEQLIRFYEETDKPSEAAKWKNELKALKSAAPLPPKL